MFAEFNFHSSEWATLRKWADQELIQLREKNDAADLSEVQTALVRGQILFCKKLLGIPEEVERDRSTQMPSDSF